jgi:hypothetical protein
MTLLGKLAVMRRNGIVYPWRTFRAARKAGLGLALACALLDQETGGGRNVFGHDRDSDGHIIFHGQEGTVPVTREGYQEYKRFRDATGTVPPFGRMQGVGPMQLTWYAFQDEADKLGGCWRPGKNMRTGFQIVKRNIDTAGSMRAGVRQYNGSGPEAEEYADAVLAGREVWRERLSL